MIKKQLLKKGLMLCSLIFFTCSISSIAYAEVETETAGSSLGKEALQTSDIAVYSSTSGEWQQNSTGWWYLYNDGTFPSSTWIQIDGKWYYFNSDGYWVDDNSYEAASLKGVDVSAWQEYVDWSAVKNDGIQFAFVRISHGSNHTLDTYYDRNMRNATAVGIPVGVYYYSTAKTELQSIADAQFVIDHLQGYKISYPVVLDLEDSSQKSLSKAELGRIAKVFFDEIKKAGYEPMLYCNEDWYRNYIDISYISDVDRWVARYENKYNPSISRSIWQSTSKGRVAGIQWNADVDFGYKDYTQTIIPRFYSSSDYQKTRGLWQHSNKGWFYSYVNGGYAANTWEYINGHWYWFDSDGYMVTGWRRINGYWYFMDSNGAMQTSWIYVSDHWYYLDSDGTMQTGWLSRNNHWYYLNSNGEMKTGWVYLSDHWYYLDSDGAMLTGWNYDNGFWYYMNSDGTMLTNQWISGIYYVKDNGTMAVSEWVDGNRYYVGSDGVWVPSPELS